MLTANFESELGIPRSFRTCLEDRAHAVGSLVHRALLKEVELTPKPGLVDRLNSGAHRDMDIGTFYASIEAIADWFPIFYRIGASTRDLSPEDLLESLRPAGRDCEEVMLQATLGVNTHKGSVFSMGLLSAAVGRLDCRDDFPRMGCICTEVAQICSRLVQAELLRVQVPRTAGERLFQAYGMTGVRGEAASGFQTVREFGLPAFERILSLRGSEEEALQDALLHLLAANRDTNLVHRGGFSGLAYVQRYARTLIDFGGVRSSHFESRLSEFDSDLTKRGLSPGGSADLLAVTWFLSRFSDSVRDSR